MTKSDLWPFFVMTDHRCVIDDAAYPGIPVFFCETGMLEPVSAYFRWLGYECRRPPSTLKTYAYHRSGPGNLNNTLRCSQSA